MSTWHDLCHAKESTDAWEVMKIGNYISPILSKTATVSASHRDLMTLRIVYYSVFIRASNLCE